MTNEEAIKRLLYDWFVSLGGQVCVDMDKKDGFREAIGIAVTALRAQQTPVKLDRIRWEGCEHCKGDLEGYTSCFRDVNGRSRHIYIPEGEANIVVPGMYQHKVCVPIQFCPNCGRPLTEDAWAELERRIVGNDGTADV